jgi:hypothetical protein
MAGKGLRPFAGDEIAFEFRFGHADNPQASRETKSIIQKCGWKVQGKEEGGAGQKSGVRES